MAKYDTIAHELATFKHDYSAVCVSNSSLRAQGRAYTDQVKALFKNYGYTSGEWTGLALINPSEMAAFRWYQERFETELSTSYFRQADSSD